LYIRSIKKGTSISPSFILVVVLLGCSSSHFSCLCWWGNTRHIWHIVLCKHSLVLVLLGHIGSIPCHVSSILLLLTITRVHHSLGLFFSVKNHELFTELLIWHSEFFSDLDKTSQAIDVVRVLSMDVFINFQGFVKQIHPSEA